MNRIKLGIFIFFFLSTVWFSHFKKADYRTCRIHYSAFRRSAIGFLEVGVRNRFIVFWVDTVGFSTPLFFDGYKICILQLPQRVHRFLTATVQQLAHLVDGVIQINFAIIVGPSVFAGQIRSTQNHRIQQFGFAWQGAKTWCLKQKIGQSYKTLGWRLLMNVKGFCSHDRYLHADN